MHCVKLVSKSLHAILHTWTSTGIVEVWSKLNNATQSATCESLRNGRSSKGCWKQPGTPREWKIASHLLKVTCNEAANCMPQSLYVSHTRRRSWILLGIEQNKNNKKCSTKSASSNQNYLRANPVEGEELITHEIPSHTPHSQRPFHATLFPNEHGGVYDILRAISEPW